MAYTVPLNAEGQRLVEAAKGGVTLLTDRVVVATFLVNMLGRDGMEQLVASLADIAAQEVGLDGNDDDRIAFVPLGFDDKQVGGDTFPLTVAFRANTYGENVFSGDVDHLIDCGIDDATDGEPVGFVDWVSYVMVPYPGAAPDPTVHDFTQARDG